MTIVIVWRGTFEDMIPPPTSQAVEGPYLTESLELVPTVPNPKFDATASCRVSIALPEIYNAFAKLDKSESRKH